jgi:hypothetical protein
MVNRMFQPLSANAPIAGPRLWLAVLLLPMLSLGLLLALQSTYAGIAAMPALLFCLIIVSLFSYPLLQLMHWLARGLFWRWMLVALVCGVAVYGIVFVQQQNPMFAVVIYGLVLLVCTLGWCILYGTIGWPAKRTGLAFTLALCVGLLGVNHPQTTVIEVRTVVAGHQQAASHYLVLQSLRASNGVDYLAVPAGTPVRPGAQVRVAQPYYWGFTVGPCCAQWVEYL